MIRKFILVIIFFMIFICSSVGISVAATSSNSESNQEILIKAEVLEVLSEEVEQMPGSGISATVQKMRAKLLEGPQKGIEVEVINDYVKAESGDTVILSQIKGGKDDSSTFYVKNIDRSRGLLIFGSIFVFFVILFLGRQGIRSLLGLVGSFFVISYILLPSLLNGYPPVITSILVASVILFFAIFLTHGFNKVSLVAFCGTFLAVNLTGILAYLGVELAHLSGLASDETFYLNINTSGQLNLSGLLLGGIMIGILGVLDDIAVTQAAVVRELYSANTLESPLRIYSRAINVGKEHVGALVNTLALAYTGASLPLLLLFSNTQTSFMTVINQELIATEIIRTFVGSIGLILTVPITTLLAVWLLKGTASSKNGGRKLHHHA